MDRRSNWNLTEVGGAPSCGKNMGVRGGEPERVVGGGTGMVISGFEEKCLNCPVPISGTIQIQAEGSYTAGDFDAHHSVDQQRSGPDRVMTGVSVSGTCRACGASFSYKVFVVMQLRLKGKAAQQS